MKTFRMFGVVAGRLSTALSVVLSALLSLATGAAQAQAWPTKPVNFVVPFAAGGSSDATTRALAQELSRAWGQPVLVDNRPGGATNIASAHVAKSAPDGHTVLFATDAVVLNTLLYAKMPFDPWKDLLPVTAICHLDQVLMVPASMPVNNLREFVAYAKANPGKLNYGSYGSGSPPHLVYELFKSVTGTFIVHIPYKGVAPVVTDFLAGNLHTILTGVYSALPLAKSNKAKVLAIEGRRSPLLPEVPTFAEAGFPDVRAPAWWGYMVPAGTPQPLVSRISRDIVAVVNDPEFRQKRLIAFGLEPIGNTPEQFAAMMRETTALWGPIIKSAGIRVD